MSAAWIKSRLLSLPLLFWIFVTAATAGYLWGAAAVPFHPDETSYLFMSGDAEIFWQQPADLFWQPENEDNVRQRYRELDAPLTRNLLALGRWIAGLPAPQNDWDWSKTWPENQQAGALPGSNLLLTGRLAMAVLFPFSLIFLFLAARNLANEPTAWIAVLLLASNSLVLLHTRRAMAESILLLGAILAIWASLKDHKHPWVIAFSAALAFCAKYSLAALAPAGLLAVLFQAARQPRRSLARIAGQIILYGATFILVTLFLHPFTWRHPLPAIQAAVKARQELAGAQTRDRPEQALTTLGPQLIAMIGSLYLTPPLFSETGNYQVETRPAETAYLDNPMHSLFRSIPAGAAYLTLSLFGFTIGIWAAFRDTGNWRLIVLLAATILQAVALLALVPLPWQRYYMPLVPFAILWTAYGINRVGQALHRSIRLNSRQIYTARRKTR